MLSYKKRFSKNKCQTINHISWISATQGETYAINDHMKMLEDSAFQYTHEKTISGMVQQSFSCEGAKVWNNIPNNIRNVESAALFKKQVRNYFLGQ